MEKWLYKNDTCETPIEKQIEKELPDISKSFSKFVVSGFQESLFTKKIYDYLYLHCSFIAYYGKRQFYRKYFNNLEGFNNFLNIFKYGCKDKNLLKILRGYL